MTTPDQQSAYDEIVAWLDALPPLDLPGDLQACLDEAWQSVTPSEMEDMSRTLRSAAEHPQQFIDTHAESLRSYQAMKESAAWKSSPAARLSDAIRHYQCEHGYNEVFLPAMRRLSPSYAAYCAQLQAADALFLDAMK